MTEEAALLVHYMPIVVRHGTTRKEDRIFAASVIAHTRKGRPVTDKQVWRMRRIVSRFKDIAMEAE